MSQFQLSDEDEAPQSSKPASGSPSPRVSKPTPPSAKPNPPAEKASEFHFFGDDSPAESPAPPTSSPASPPAPTPQKPPVAGAPTGPKPLQPRVPGGAPAPAPLQPRARPTSAAPNAAPTAVKPAIEPESGILTAQQLGMEPTDGFSAALFGVSASIRRGLDAVEPFAAWLLRIALPVAVLCLAYLAAVTFMGAARNTGTPQFADIFRFSSYASTGLKWALLASGIGVLLIAYADRRWGAGVALFGVLLSFGAPLALKAMLGGANPIAAMISRDLRGVGTILLALGLFKAVCDLGSFLMELPTKMRQKHASVGAGRPLEAKQQRIAREANMLSPCWQLPFCRESVRVLCPAFLARKTCWKFGRGCYCDEEMIGRIVRGEPLEVIKAPTKMSRQKPPCGNCYIYLEHQTYKFRILSPLALPATIALCYFAWPLYSKVFMAFNTNFDKFWKSLSFDVTTLTPDAIKANPEAAAKAAEAAADAEVIALWAQNALGATLGFLALIYVSKAIEWAIFKAKL